jgi:hypothetical protein
MSNHLLYEWQVPLLPHYTPLPVSLVRTLGTRILEYRDPDRLKRLLLEGAPPDPPPDSGTAKPEASGR